MESKFKYWKTVKEALVLDFNNLMLTVTLIIFGFFETLFIALFLSRIPVLKADSLGNVQLRLNPQTVILFFILILVIIVLSAFVSGWLFFRIGNIARKTESKIFDFKASLRKGWVFLRSMILAGAIFLILYFIILLFFFLSSHLGAAKPIVGVLILLFTVPVVIFLVILTLLFFVSLLHFIPIISLENFGPITSLKLSISHFRNNKLHTLAIIGILILLAIPVIILTLALSGNLMNTAVINTVDGTNLFAYQFEHPLEYSLFNVVLSIPTTFLSVWFYLFLTIAYKKKTQPAAKSKSSD